MLKISARELYGYIEPAKSFTSWILDGAHDYGYEEGEDWIKILPSPDSPGYMTAKVNVMLSERFASKLHDVEMRRRAEAIHKKPVVEYTYPYPGEIVIENVG